MRRAWNKGLTKSTDARVLQTSRTMRTRKIDNFKKWRDSKKKEGLIKTLYPPFKQNGDLVELIGVVLGDGNIGTFPRCERLRIVGTTTNQGFVRRYADLVEKIFQKRPAVCSRTYSGATDISLYERHISKRLGIPADSRKSYRYALPRWIGNKKANALKFLRGLYEAEGTLCFHAPTYTHKFIFSNRNPALLNLVYRLIKQLGFHPHRSLYAIQVSRKMEVQKLANLLEFRHYDS